MSAYGIQVIGSDGVVNSNLPNSEVVDFITTIPTSSGSKNYALGPGETLHFSEIIDNGSPWIFGDIYRYTGLSLSGNTLSWVVATKDWGWISTVIVYKTKVVT